MRLSTFAIAAGLGLALAGCSGSGGHEVNRSLNSVHQPVVSRDNYVLDVTIGADGIGAGEMRRTAEWFDVLGLGYGDRVAVDFGDGYDNRAVRARIAELAQARGMTLAPLAPVTSGVIAPGTVRIVVTRSTATVPGCPDWTNNREANYGGRTHSNYGCAVNSNIAAMVADPEDLIQGREAGATNTRQGSKAIQAYRDRKAMAGQAKSVKTGGN